MIRLKILYKLALFGQSGKWKSEVRTEVGGRGSVWRSLNKHEKSVKQALEAANDHSKFDSKDGKSN